MKNNSVSNIIFPIAIILVLTVAIITDQPCFGASSREVLLINTELPGRSNCDPMRIDNAIRLAGASQTRIISWTLLSPDFLKRNQPGAIILSGQGTPWVNYDQKKLKRLCEILRSTQVPLLGICGGHQLLAIAFGGKVGPIHVVRLGIGYAGDIRERGWMRVTIHVHHDALFSSSPAEPSVWLNHCDEVKILPPRFKQTVSDQRQANQAMECQSRCIFGVQFHPEVNDNHHTFGLQLLRNFLALTSG